MDSFLVSGVLTASLFLSPAIRIPFAGAGKSIRVASDDRFTRAMVLTIPEGRVTTVCVSPALEPAVNFYRRRFPLNWRGPASPDFAAQEGDYYLLLKSDSEQIVKRKLRVLSSEGGETLAGH